ncbi:hypothetical protein JCM11491_006283 [Sporobolomyces phaffii]
MLLLRGSTRQLVTPVAASIRARATLSLSLSLSPPHRIHLVASTPSPLSPRDAVRAFHSTRRRSDVLFVSAPLFKQSLLYLVRFSLVLFPFLWRYKFFRRYPATARWFLWVPAAALSLVVALGLDQSDQTSRWRLLLMSEREEIEWSNQRFDELMATEAILLVPPSDPRIVPLKQVCDRLVQALADESPVSFSEQARLDKIRTGTGTPTAARRIVRPSATTDGLRMPYRPETGNPEKVLAKDGWSIYVIDAPTINAFVLASRDVFCYTGLLSLTEGDEDLLAAVIGHEIEQQVDHCLCTSLPIQKSHVEAQRKWCCRRHGADRVSSVLGALPFTRDGSGVVFDILRGFSWALTISFPLVGDCLSSAFTFVDQKLSQRAYSRQLETEADWLGMELMARAGYDPRAAVRLWEILTEAEDELARTGTHAEVGGRTTIWDHVALVRTHPTGRERLARLEERLPRAIELYDEARATRRVEEEVRIARTKANEARALGAVKGPRAVEIA